MTEEKPLTSSDIIRATIIALQWLDYGIENNLDVLVDSSWSDLLSCLKALADSIGKESYYSSP